MKRSIIIVLGLAALAAPVATAGTPARVSPVQRIVAQESRGGHVAGPAQTQQLSPVQRISVQEQARRFDPAYSGPGPIATSVQIVESGGFHWGDAGIGAAVIVAALLMLAGSTLVVRSRRPERA
jgi:hypothetical protein